MQLLVKLQDSEDDHEIDILDLLKESGKILPDTDFIWILRNTWFCTDCNSIEEAHIALRHLVEGKKQLPPQDTQTVWISNVLAAHVEATLEDFRDSLTWGGENNHDVYINLGDGPAVYFVTVEGGFALRHKITA